MGQKRLGSVDLVLFGQQRTYDFSEEPVELDIELPDDELEAQIAAGQEVLRHVESLEVQLVSGKPVSATVNVKFTVRYSGEVTVDIDLDGEASEDEVREGIEMGNFYAVTDAIASDLEYIPEDATEIDNIEVELFDEDGNTWEE